MFRVGCRPLASYGPLLRLSGWLISLLLLAACGGSLENQGKVSHRLGSPLAISAPPVAVAGLNGLPSDKQAVLLKALAVSAHKRDIRLVNPDTPGAWQLSGQFNLRANGAGDTTLTHHWRLSDAQGKPVHRITGVEPARSGSWEAIGQQALQRVAGQTAEDLSSQLSVLGYATRAAGMPPPIHALQPAGLHAEKELDYETILGPGRTRENTPRILAESLGIITGDESLKQLDADNPENPQLAAVPPDQTPREGASPANPAPPGTQQQSAGTSADISIDAVAVTGVKGSPGPGNKQLATSLREVLRQAGWPVHDRPRANALTITGEVSLSAPAGDTQEVALVWTVAMPSGRVLGTVKQANSISAGSLDNGWGGNAAAVSQAAASGIFDIVKKAQDGG